LLYFHGVSRRGLVGPDEPRYAAIARNMAESGDWITPRLDGEPWFEKPALLYWMGAAAHLLGAPDDTATRLPVALMSAAFLVFFYWRLKREFDSQTAEYATLILATSAGWVSFSQVGGFDLPLSAWLAAALLVLLPWVREPSPQTRNVLPVFGALLGLSVLAKGLVGLALAAVSLIAVIWRRNVGTVLRELIHPRTILPFLAVALPWYLLCYWRNGLPFLEEFFWRHHWERIADESIQHVQPFWFYVPVLLVALLPWTPLLTLPPSAEQRRDPRVRFLIAWAVGTLVVFSVPTNKLPGYLLPALPPLAALGGMTLAQRGIRPWLLTACAALLCLLPVAEAVVPGALANGLSRAWPPDHLPRAALAGAVSAVVAIALLSLLGRTRAALLAFAALAAISFVHFKLQAFTEIDKRAGTRPLWEQIEPRASQVCVGEVRRHVADGLRFYSRGRLPDCSSQRRPFRVESDPPVLSGPFPVSKAP
jgi:4-amino-4-deoxy-L-arabinose transferase-like glycosyltransferase